MEALPFRPQFFLLRFLVALGTPGEFRNSVHDNPLKHKGLPQWLPGLNMINYDEPIEDLPEVGHIPALRGIEN